MIRLQQVSKSYPSHVVFRQLSLEFSANLCTAVMGPSGSGKTTLTLLIAGLISPESGTIEISGSVVDSPATRVPPHRRNVGMVFQADALWPHLNVRQHLEFPLGRWPRPQSRARVAEVLEFAELTSLRNRYPGELSGGETRRLALARAVVRRPSILLLDEPFTGMDPAQRKRLINLLSELVQGSRTTMVLVTQHPEEAESLADEAVVIQQGEVVGHIPWDLSQANELMRCAKGDEI